MREYLYTVVYTQDERGVWTAFVPQLNNLASEGDSIEEAKQMIQEAIELYLESLEADNLPIPEDLSGRNTMLGTVAVAR